MTGIVALKSKIGERLAKETKAFGAIHTVMQSKIVSKKTKLTTCGMLIQLGVL